MLKKLTTSAIKTLAFSLSIFLTMFIFLNSFELFFSKDIPFIAAIEKTNLEKMFPENSQFSTPPEPNLSGNKIGDYGKPITLIVPSLGKRLEILPGIISKDNSWLAQSNKAHYFLYSNNQNPTTVIYLIKSWKTIDHPENLKAKDNIFIDTNRNWRYAFQIGEIGSLDLNNKIILSNTQNQNLVILIEDQKNKQIVVIKSKFQTVLNTK